MFAPFLTNNWSSSCLSEHIEQHCSPEKLYYDDDTGEEVDELKKATIQIKEKLDEMFDLWHLKFGSPEEDEEVYVFIVML